MPNGRRSPGVGHNANAVLPEHQNLLLARATEKIFERKIADIKEQQKRARSRFESMGIVSGDLKLLKDMEGLDEGEMLLRIRRMGNVIGAMQPNLAPQMDFFQEAPDPDQLATYRVKGQQFGMDGKACTPPPALSGENLQAWQEGWQAGSAAYKAAEKSILMDAASGKKDGVVDGTKDNVRARAAADFAKDNPDVKAPGAQPDWSDFSNMPAEWSDDQNATFMSWYDGIGPTEEVKISHPGIAAKFEAVKRANAESGFQEATPEELDGQAVRPSVQEAAAEKQAKAEQKRLSQSERAAKKREAAGLK